MTTSYILYFGGSVGIEPISPTPQAYGAVEATHHASLARHTEKWRSTTELWSQMGLPGLEPGTSCAFEMLLHDALHEPPDI
jgi:hypothetical protein